MQIREAIEQDFEAYMNVSKDTCYSMELKGSPKQNHIRSNCLSFFSKTNEVAKNIFIQCMLKGKILLLEKEGIVIAFAVLVEQGRIVKILDFVVTTSEQGQGVGTYFAKSIIEDAKKARVKKIWLYCEFKGAKEFWKKLGFLERAQGSFEKIL